MKDFIYCVLGRTSLLFDCLRPLLAGKDARKDKTGGGYYDKTGFVVKDAKPLEHIWKEAGIIFVTFDSLAHSFWRAQEFSLFSEHSEVVQRPLLDFGCGDGSFASVLHREVEYGIDIDPEALQFAEKYKVYNKLLQSSASSIPMGTETVRTVVSNSVLEHAIDLPGTLREICRVLEKGGRMLFTVPVKQFERDLTKYFGHTASEQINRESYHRNLLEVEEWRALLADAGFEVISVIQFQPDWFTFWYRMFRLLGDRGLGRFFPGIGIRVWERYRTQLVEMVRKSTKETKCGANIFVIAMKN